MANRRQRVHRGFVAISCLAASSIFAAQTAGLHAPLLPSNHALIITVSEYQRSPLPGVVNDRKLANELAQRFGVPRQNIVELSEREVTREGLKEALAGMNQVILPGDKLYVYFSGHGARFFSKATGQCTESIVMQDMHVVTNTEFANMLKPLSAKTDKTIVMLDSCHSGGIAHAASARDLALGTPLRAKFLQEASSPQCALAVNDRGFSETRGVDLATTDNNLVILAASRNNEIAWDTSRGGALTYNFGQCLDGGATDADHSGSLSMRELTECVQSRLDKTQAESARQHATLAGNTALVPAFVEGASGAASSGAGIPGAGSAPTASTPAATAATADPSATLNDIYSQRDDRWQVQANLSQPTLRIGTNLAMSIRSQRDGFVYMFYQGTQPGSFYLLFPNQLDSNNAIAADQALKLPREGWNVTALGPRGTDHVMVMVTATPRDFSAMSLPAEYVSMSGPFEKIRPTVQAAAHIGQIATLSAAAGKAACRTAADKRDLGVARECSNVFGASMASVEETE
jgi:hypothetical protein